MKLVRFASAVLALNLSHSAVALEGQFDRTAEVDGYLRIIQSATRGTLTETADKIYEARIYDERLASALYEKLAADAPTLDPKNAVDNKYRNLMVAAIAGTGVMEHAPALARICAAVETRKRPTTCEKHVAKMEWYRKRNLTMASRQHHVEGDDMRVSQIMNLVMSEDYALKEEGAAQMNWGKVLAPRLMEAIEPQVVQALGTVNRSTPDEKVQAIAAFVKMLGFSGNPKYRDTLEQAYRGNNGFLIKKRAQQALKRMKKLEREAQKRGGQ